MVPQRGPYAVRCPVSRANGLFSCSYFSEFPVRSSATKQGKSICVHRLRKPTQTDGLHTMECGLVPQGVGHARCMLNNKD
jgi:hypothetical protein